MKKVLFDYQIFNQKFGGISNLFVKHFEVFQKGSEIEMSLPIKYFDNLPMKVFGRFGQGEGGCKEKIIKKIIGKKRSTKQKNKINKNLAIESLKNQNFDIFHPTYYDNYFLEYIKNKPFVLDIHDMTPEIFPEFFNSKNYNFEDKEILAKKATKIIAVSNNTKKDLIDIYNINESKIEVIYRGNTLEYVDIENVRDKNFEEKLPKKYLLFVGNRGGYKNFNFFITAIKDILLSDKDLNLLCTGSEFGSSEIQFINYLGLTQKIIRVRVENDDQMALAYKGAKAFAFPSLYEGFGLPILEAFSCGCPVVASDVSSIPEIAKDGAIYFNPKDFSSIKNAVKKTLYDEEARAKIIANGFSRLKDFSWQKSVEETIRLYNEIP